MNTNLQPQGATPPREITLDEEVQILRKNLSIERNTLIQKQNALIDQLSNNKVAIAHIDQQLVNITNGANRIVQMEAQKQAIASAMGSKKKKKK